MASLLASFAPRPLPGPHPDGRFPRHRTAHSHLHLVRPFRPSPGPPKTKGPATAVRCGSGENLEVARCYGIRARLLAARLCGLRMTIPARRRACRIAASCTRRPREPSSGPSGHRRGHAVAVLSTESATGFRRLFVAPAIRTRPAERTARAKGRRAARRFAHSQAPSPRAQRLCAAKGRDVPRISALHVRRARRVANGYTSLTRRVLVHRLATESPPGGVSWTV